jgi:hypothetical protein
VALTARLWAIVKSPAFVAFITGPWLVLALLGAVLLLRQKDKDNGILLGGWFLANVLSIYAVGRFYNHYYIVILPALALLIPTGVEFLLRNWKAIPAQVFFVLALPIISMSPIALTLHVYAQGSPNERHLAKYGDYMFWETQSQDFARWINERTEPGDYIFNLGFESELYFYSDRRTPTRFYFDHAFGLDEKYEELAIQELSANPPVYVIDSARYENKTPLNYYSEPIHEWVAANYDYLGKYYYADVYRLKGHTQ